MMQDNERITQGTLRTSTGAPLPLERTDIKALITGPVARVEVKQLFRNATGEPIEAVYLFPLPHSASVHAMRFRIGERTVEATIKEKEEARRAYDAARREGRTATLLEQDRPNLFTLSVANIKPDEAIEVELVYQERLAYDEGEFRFVFPMVTQERHHAAAPASPAGGAARPAEASPGAPPKIRPPRAATGERTTDVSVDVTIQADSAGPPRSPSHHVIVEERRSNHYHVRLHEADSIPNRDFVLAYQVAAQGIRPRAYFERKPDRIGTFMLVVTPPVALPEETPLAERDAGGATSLRCTNCGGALRDPSAVHEFPAIGQAFRCEYCGVVVAVSRDGARVGQPRDVIFLVDRSSSMRGGSVPQARRAVRLILEHLGAEDAVQCFAFDHERLAADGLGDGYLPIGKETIAQIDALLAGVAARGGTELEEALERAAKLPLRKGRTRLCVLITDAAVGNDGRILRKAPEILGADTRLYVLGLGPAADRYLVERLARVGGGASDVLLPKEDVETVVPRFARRVRQAGPVLRNLRLQWEDAVPLDVYPSPIPDLFGGQTVQLLGRFSGTGPSRLILTGEQATGEPFRQEIDVTLPEVSDEIPGLERLWARLRIDARIARLAEAPGDAADVRLEVLSLALKHALLSPYTALVAEDSEKRVDVPARRVDVPVAAVAGREQREGAGKGGVMVDDDDMELDAASPYPSDRLGGIDEFAAHTLDEAPAVFRSAAMPPPAMGAPPPAAPPAFGAGAPMPPMPARMAPPASYVAPPAPPSSAAYAAPFARPSASAPASAAMPMPCPKSSAPLMDLGKTRTTSVSADEPERASAPRGGGILSTLRGFFAGSPERSVEATDEGGVSDEEDAESEALTMIPPAVSASSRPPLRAAGTDDYTAPMLEYAAKKGIGELDLVFLVDETGSMGAYIDEVKRRLLEIVDTLRAAPLCRSLRMGLVSYRDHPPQDDTFASRVVPLTADIESIRTGVARMQASGGGDGPESVTDGLYDLVRLDWRPRAARVVVWVGDAPPHGVEPHNDGFPEGCPCGHHWYTQAESCREMGIVIHAVGCLPTLRQYVGAEGVFKTVAGTSRGLYLPLSEALMLIPLITGVAEVELDKQRIEEHIAEVLAGHEEALQKADDQEKVRFVTDVLQQEGVRPRRLLYDPDQIAPPPLCFGPITPADVEAGFSQLRRLGRTTL